MARFHSDDACRLPLHSHFLPASHRDHVAVRVGYRPRPVPVRRAPIGWRGTRRPSEARNAGGQRFVSQGVGAQKGQ